MSRRRESCEGVICFSTLIRSGCICHLGCAQERMKWKKRKGYGIDMRILQHILLYFQEHTARQVELAKIVWKVQRIYSSSGVSPTHGPGFCKRFLWTHRWLLLLQLFFGDRDEVHVGVSQVSSLKAMSGSCIFIQRHEHHLEVHASRT